MKLLLCKIVFTLRVTWLSAIAESQKVVIEIFGWIYSRVTYSTCSHASIAIALMQVLEQYST